MLTAHDGVEFLIREARMDRRLVSAANSHVWISDGFEFNESYYNPHFYYTLFTLKHARTAERGEVSLDSSKYHLCRRCPGVPIQARASPRRGLLVGMTTARKNTQIAEGGGGRK